MSELHSFTNDGNNSLGYMLGCDYWKTLFPLFFFFLLVQFTIYHSIHRCTHRYLTTQSFIVSISPTNFLSVDCAQSDNFHSASVAAFSGANLPGAAGKLLTIQHRGVSGQEEHSPMHHPGGFPSHTSTGSDNLGITGSG